MKLDSIKNISDMIISDIKKNRNIQLFDIMNLNELLSFKDSLKMNKSYYTNDLLSLKYALIEIKRNAMNKIKKYYGIYY